MRGLLLPICHFFEGFFLKVGADGRLVVPFWGTPVHELQASEPFSEVPIVPCAAWNLQVLLCEYSGHGFQSCFQEGYQS